MGVRGIIKFFTIRAVEGIVGILLITFMPNLPPDAKYSESYSLTPVLPFEGPFTLNDQLQSAEIWHKGDLIGPEAFAVYNGELYTTVHGGNVVKLIGDKIVPVVKFGKQCKGLYQEHICGRPLGMQFDKQGGLYVADAYYGIFKVDVKTGKQLQLVSMDQEINGRKPKLPNSVAVASNGDIYWTDSSTEFFLYDGLFDMLADGSGRLIHYDAKTKKNTVLIDKLHFANGVRLAADESFVITTETARCRVYRYYLQGPKKGTYDVFLDGIPGLPDNIQTDGKDGFLISLVIGRDDDYPPPLNILGPFPLLRKFISRVLGLTELGFKVIDQIYPCEWAERAVHYIGHFGSIPHSFSSPRQSIMHISQDGVILDTIHSLNGSIIGMSEAFIFKDMLYMGSPFNHHAARIPLEKVGWGHLALKESDYPSSSTTTETANPKVAPESKNIPAPTQQPTPKAATPSQSTTPPSQKVTKPVPTPAPKVATPTPSQTSKQSPSSPPTKESPPSTKQAPPSPTKQAPPSPTKQTQPPLPTKEIPPPSPIKETPSPPPAKQTPPSPPIKQTSSPPPTKQTTPPPPTKETAPPPPTKQTPPTTQTPPPPPTKQTPSPSSTKQTPSPAKQTQPPPAPPTKQTQPPPPPPTEQAPSLPPPPAKQTQPPPPPPSTQPPKVTTPTQVPKVDTYTSTQPSQQLPSPSVKQVPTKQAPSSPKEESSQSPGPKTSTTAKASSAQPTKPSTEPPKIPTTPTTQNQATPKQAPQPVGNKNEL